MQKRVEEFHSALQQAVAARVDVSKINMETGDVRERSLTLPPSEFATLKDILSRTKLIPVSAEPPTMATIIADDFYLVLLDAKGQALETHHIHFTWTSESNIKPRSPHTIFDPHWYLPDADYRRLLQLPTIRAAEKGCVPRT